MTTETYYRLREERAGGERFNFIDAEVRLAVMGTRPSDRPTVHHFEPEHMYTAAGLKDRLGATDLLTAWDDDDHEIHRCFLAAIEAEVL